MEEHYKMSVKTTDKEFSRIIPTVEEHYKMGVTSTFRGNGDIRYLVEENYKKIQTTNNQLEFYAEKDVEELYKQETDG